MLYVIAALAILLLLFAILLIRTLRCRENETSPAGLEACEIDIAQAARKLAGAIQIPTISQNSVEETDPAPFLRLHDYLYESFPHVHRVMQRETVNTLSLLYHWPGKDPAAPPSLFCAHLDVVPVEPGTEEDWTHPPFSGAITGEAVWGRGTLDIKVQVIALLEAAENLIAQGFTPEHDIWFAFGHDEEVRRRDGADHIAALLEKRGVRPALVLDEGGCVTAGALKGTERPVAFIGIAEKGFVNLKLEAEGTGGHSSMPPHETAAALIGRAVHRIGSIRPPLRLTPATRAMFRSLAPAMPFGQRMLLANLWLFAPLFVRIFGKSTSGRAMLSTTCAATMLHGSPAPNVLPQHAGAVFNARLLHGDSSEKLLRLVTKRLADIEVRATIDTVYEPSAVSPAKGEQWDRLCAIIRSLYPEAIIAPYLVVGGTDARKYETISSHIYRFSPYLLNNSDLSLMHGTNEHISLENLRQVITFYSAMFQQ